MIKCTFYHIKFDELNMINLFIVFWKYDKTQYDKVFEIIQNMV